MLSFFASNSLQFFIFHAFPFTLVYFMHFLYFNLYFLFFFFGLFSFPGSPVLLCHAFCNFSEPPPLHSLVRAFPFLSPFLRFRFLAFLHFPSLTPSSFLFYAIFLFLAFFLPSFYHPFSSSSSLLLLFLPRDAVYGYSWVTAREGGQADNLWHRYPIQDGHSPQPS